MGKGQAAMEFIMTYGWAILVVLAAIGALAYFGVLSPSRFMPEKCTGPSGLDCLDKATIVSGGAGAGYIEFVLKNNMGSRITVYDVSHGATYAPTEDSPQITGTIQDSANEVGGMNAIAGTGGSAPGAPVPFDTNGVPVADGEMIKIRIYSTAALAQGRLKGNFVISYANAETGQDHRATVAVTGVVA